MILYNITIKISRERHDEWLEWMRNVHIPDVLATGYFQDHKFCRLLGQEEEDGLTYAVQYFARSMEELREYQTTHAERLRKEVRDRFADDFVAFRTLLEVL